MGEAWMLVASHRRWMAWDLTLAFVPLALGYVLFRPHTRRSPGWWLGLACYIAFLPNAPYVISDLVHLPADARLATSSKVIWFGLVPLYAAFVTAGMQAYVLSLRLLRRYIRTIGKPRLVIAVDAAAPLCAAVGFVFGRVDRLNSWEPFLRPDKLWVALSALPSQTGTVLLVATVILLTGQAIWVCDRLGLGLARQFLQRWPSR